ncbi:MAG: SUMF1/EgtB/PvdO family nonheme iron enzyme, partial [Planctomycetes bacterium]|nr:SUMF1/EgtB/PvdO family nonheme iron enzyme [Planctomycetota bacterium]
SQVAADLAARRNLYVAETELPWSAFSSWWQSNGNRFPEKPQPDRGDMPVTGVSAQAFDAFARSIGARLPTSQEWQGFASSSGFRFKERYKSERSPNCNSAKFIMQRGNDFRTDLKALPVRNADYGGHGVGGKFYHLGGNVSEVVSNGGNYSIAGSSFSSRQMGPLDEEPYKGYKDYVGVRLVIDP